jgi:ankyrin repeat protein
MKRLFVYLPLYVVFACLYFNLAAPNPLKYYNRGASVRSLRLDGFSQARKPLFSHDLTRMALLETREETEGDYVHKKFAAVIYRVDGEKAEECSRIDLGDEEDFQWGSDDDTIVSYSLYGAHVRRISSGETLEVHYHGLENWSEDYREIERLADGASVSPKWTYLVLDDRLLRRVEGTPAKAETAESEEESSYNDWNAEPAVRQDYEVLGKLKGGEGPSFFAFDESEVYVADKYFPTCYALPSLKILSEGNRAVFATRETQPAFVFIESYSTTFVDGVTNKVTFAEYPFNTGYLSNNEYAVIQPDGRIWMGSLGSLTTALPKDPVKDSFLFVRPGETIEPSNAFIKAMALDGDGHTLRFLCIPDDCVLGTIDLDVAKTQLQSGFERIATRHLWVSFLAALPATALVFFFEKRLLAALASFFGIFPWLFRELPYLVRERLNETLHEACRTGDIRAAKRLSRWPLGGVRMKKRNSAGLTPLMVAVGTGHAEIALLLLRRGADMNATDPTGMTALHLASSKAQNGEVARALVESGADLSAEWKGCARPARLAAESGNLAALEAMAKKSPQVLGLADSDGVTPVLAAAEHGNADSFRLCAEAAPQSLKNARAEDGATAVYLAAKNGMEESLALAARLAPESFAVSTREGSTPAMAAASKGLVACLGVIAKVAPETLGLSDEKGVTPALLAAQEGNTEALALIASFAMESLGKPRTADNVTPAYAAAFNGHGACMEIVANAAPQSLRVKNKEGFASAAVAAQNGHLNVLKSIFAHDPGAFAEPPTPAYVAAQFGRVDCVRFLLENAPDSFTVADETGSLPLHVAAVAAREEIYRMIVEKFPEMRTHRNNTGATPESILAQAREIRRAEEERQARSRAASSHSGSGIVLWGIGFRPNEDMLKSAIVTAGKGNMAAWLVLGSLPHVLDSMDETPSEIQATMRYDRIAKKMGWKSLTPKYQFLGLADGRKLIMAFPPVV